MSYATIEALYLILGIIHNEIFVLFILPCLSLHNEIFVICILPCLSLHFMSIGVMLAYLVFNEHPF